jgi:hypothetical protein
LGGGAASHSVAGKEISSAADIIEASTSAALEMFFANTIFI